jgi:Tfp pilus assembly protein PilF
MAESNREARVKEYQAASLQADELASSGDVQGAITTITANRDKAAKAGDEDYHAFFDAEVSYLKDDAAQSIERLTAGLAWAMENKPPSDGFLFRNMGVYHSAAGDENRAIEWFDRALALNPKDFHAMLNKGVALSKMGEPDRAIEWFDKALALNPKDFHAMRQKGVSLTEKGDHDRAMEWFDKALELNPKDFHAMRERGSLHFKRGEEDRAIEWYNKALAVNPRDNDAMRSKGVALSKKGDHDRAIEWFDKALAVNPKDSNAMRQKGVSLSEKGDHDRAIEWFDKALAHNPKDYDAMRNKGVALSRKGDQDHAIEWYDKVLAVNPKDYEAMRNKGVVFSLKGEEDRAIEWFDRALTVNPKDSDAIRQKGVAFARKGEADRATEWFDNALSVNPKDYHAMREKGVALSKKGDEDRAIEWFRKALQENPADSVTYRCWAVSELNRRKFKEAFQRIRKAAELHPVQWQGDFRAVCKIIGMNADNEWQRLFPTAAKEEPTQDVRLKELPVFIQEIHRAFKKEADGYLAEKERAEKSRRDFLDLQSRLRTDLNLLMVLRRWNSYTPALPSNEHERSRGGGYFLWHAGHGTVIDPGYNFIENFALAGCRICNIHNVILTHAHNDHTMDFETLCALLHESSDLRGANPLRVRFFLNNGSFRKFGGMMDLKDPEFTERIWTLNAGTKLELQGGGSLRVLPAYHDEVLARDQAIGLLLTIPTPNGDRKVLFTSDTGLFPLRRDRPKPTADASDPKAEIWQQYLAADGGEPHVMVVHIGSIAREEFPAMPEPNPASMCYPNHLGIIGSARVITMCRPKLAVISEFGEDMKRFRLPLVRGLQSELIVPFFRDQNAPHVPRVIPGDIAFIYDLAAEKFYDCVAGDWTHFSEIDFDKGANDDPHGVYYFAAKNLGNYRRNKKMPGHFSTRLREDRAKGEGLYFV